MKEDVATATAVGDGAGSSSGGASALAAPAASRVVRDLRRALSAVHCVGTCADNRTDATRRGPPTTMVQAPVAKTMAACALRAPPPADVAVALHRASTCGWGASSTVPPAAPLP